MKGVTLTDVGWLIVIQHTFWCQANIKPWAELSEKDSKRKQH